MGAANSQIVRAEYSGLDFDPAELKKKYQIERSKRIEPAANSKYAPATNGRFADYSKDQWAKADDGRSPIHDHTEIVIVGGGFAGLLLSARLFMAGFEDIRVLDRAGDFGGTWYWNRYPGAMCDIESHIYMPLLEELTCAPKHKYAYASELFEHSQIIGRQYGLYDKALFGTGVTSAQWSDVRSLWSVETDRGDRLTANYLLLACGRQTLPKLPSLPGIDMYRGHAFHSSRWDYAYSGGGEHGELTGLRGKRVAVIGTGATAIQIVPQVAKWAKELLVCQRTPSAVGIRGQRETSGDYVDLSKPGWQKERRENFQKLFSSIAQEVDYVNDGWTNLARDIAPLSDKELIARLGREPSIDEKDLAAEIPDYEVMNGLRARIDQIVADSVTAEALKPWYRWWCKRPCFHDEYLPAFNRPNVTLVDTQGQGVRAFSEKGIVVGDKEYEVDCVIFATGFDLDTSYIGLTGFELYGREGRKWSDHWSHGTRTLHGVFTDHFPNCFLVGSYEHTSSSANVVHLLDEQASHVAYIMRETKQRGMHVVEPATEAVDDYTNMIRMLPANQALVQFHATCTPGYFNRAGTATKNDELFFGNRFRDAMSFYEFIEQWRREGKLSGIVPSLGGADGTVA